VLRAHKEMEIGTVPVSLGSALRRAFGGGKAEPASYDPATGEAGARASVNRARSDMRSMATALEACFIDNNAYPATFAQATTPIAYMTYAPADPFATDAGTPITYVRSDDGLSWLTFSVGPDQTDSGGTPPYDPSNGTMSAGDIIRRKQ
jgi:hypothetical protein